MHGQLFWTWWRVSLRIKSRPPRGMRCITQRGRRHGVKGRTESGSWLVIKRRCCDCSPFLLFFPLFASWLISELTLYAITITIEPCIIRRDPHLFGIRHKSAQACVSINWLIASLDWTYREYLNLQAVTSRIYKYSVIVHMQTKSNQGAWCARIHGFA